MPLFDMYDADTGLQRLSELARAGQRVTFVSGNFNVLHPGHLRLLKFAAEQADLLLVGVNPDTTPGVSVPAADRLANVRALSLVDHAFLLTGPPSEFIGRFRPALVVKGKEFEHRDNPEQEIVKSYGGRVVFGSGETLFSSFSMLNEEFTQTNFSSIRKATEFPRRHGFDVRSLHDCLARFAGLRMLVIGDLIVDDYITCDPLGMSQEDPTIVVTPIETKTFVGGAGVVAAHARGLGADVRFMTVVGGDEAAEFSRANLERQNIGVSMVLDETRPTTRKQRFRANGKTLLRVNHLRQHAISPELSARLLREIEAALPTTDLLLFSDFNYGCLPQPLVDAVTALAAARGIPMSADSQASSQLSDIARFKGMTLITPTEREARLALRNNEDGLAIIAGQLAEAARAETVIVTLGSEGLLVHARKGGHYTTDLLPAMNTAPKDVAGAGDVLFTSTSLALAAGVDIWRSVYLGAIAAACQVGRVGNAPLSLRDIVTELDAPG
jgi:rfaE bifunctional protein kinase chain/domain